MGKHDKKSGHGKRNLILVLFLAVLCIGGVELAVCRFYAPELYERITAPVRRWVGEAAQWGEAALSTALDALMDLAPEPAPEPEETPESQLAGEPSVVSDLPLSDPSVTELQQREEGEVLTGGSIEIVYFNQSDPAWAEQPYGSDRIGGYGCGPTAMAMAVASLTDGETDPATMSRWAAEHGYWARGSGSYLSIVEGAAKSFGLTCEPFSARDPVSLREALLSGKIMVALMGPGHFTKGGHFILLRGVTLGGNVLVADPVSVERSLTEWDAQLILDELSKSTSHGAPLWTLSSASAVPTI